MILFNDSYYEHLQLIVHIITQLKDVILKMVSLHYKEELPWLGANWNGGVNWNTFYISSNFVGKT